MTLIIEKEPILRSYIYPEFVAIIILCEKHQRGICNNYVLAFHHENDINPE